MYSIAYLIKRTYTQDEYKRYSVSEETRIKILGTVRSTSRDEQAQGGKYGLNNSFMFATNIRNYNGQEELQYNGTVYTIYRTYKVPNNNTIELYCEAKKGEM